MVELKWPLAAVVDEIIVGRNPRDTRPAAFKSSLKKEIPP
jgi:hypothetical protein